MATQVHTRSEGSGRTHRFVWSSLGQNDDGQYSTIPGAADRVIQVYGTFGGATVTIEGSVVEQPTQGNAEHWFPLTDLQGNAVSFTSRGGEYITENTTHIKVIVTGGDGTTDLTAVLLSRSTMR